jgi:hypothetical protein
VNGRRGQEDGGVGCGEGPADDVGDLLEVLQADVANQPEHPLVEFRMLADQSGERATGSG